MWRVLLLVVATLVVADATGAFDACDDTCLDDRDGRQCPPACPTCACAPHALTSVAPVRVDIARVAERPWCTVEMPAVTRARGEPAPSPALRPPIA